jgi:hypothetical protein
MILNCKVKNNVFKKCHLPILIFPSASSTKGNSSVVAVAVIARFIAGLNRGFGGS